MRNPANQALRIRRILPQPLWITATYHSLQLRTTTYHYVAQVAQVAPHFVWQAGRLNMCDALPPFGYRKSASHILRAGEAPFTRLGCCLHCAEGTRETDDSSARPKNWGLPHQYPKGVCNGVGLRGCRSRTCPQLWGFYVTAQ